nr:hypothetical protein [Bacteroidota bacterium]
MKKKLLILTGLFLCNLFLLAQIDKMKDILNDEMDTDNYTLRFFNALDGNPIKDAVVEIDGIGLYTTDFEGKVKFPRMEEDGSLAVHFKAEGYIPTDISVEVIAGTIFQNRISVSPVMAMEYVRIILDWGRNPGDLDAHFLKENGYHISYRNMKMSDDDVAKLDRDDTDSFGPETITIKEIDTDSYYEFFVHDYTNRMNDNSRKLSKSGASVKVYGNGELMEYVTIPPGDRGNKWNVFVFKNG